MTRRYVCIHGHFYQPPRENPWLEAVEQQDAAYPYHDWNERITAESYGPNAEARILDEHERITSIVNNYARISFNFGPSLLGWLAVHAQETYAAILAADLESRDRFGGHGSALAQAYNHMIMPLASERDLRTQVIWGVRDFAYRFLRPPVGMWLPETAVDLATLDALTEQGIRFTVLAPHQAAEVRRIGAREWQDVRGARIDTTQPYLQRLPSGREIALFFYDGPVARAVAFEELLRNGELFARRLLSLHGTDDRPQLAHIATDGETYGHHHRHGEMALAYALHHIDTSEPARVTNYAEFLALYPPQHEVRILEDTSWSCAHGVERWRSDCGCHTGGPAGWRQTWREPLRAALDWLRDTVGPPFEAAAAEFLHDPWAARNDYIDVLLDQARHLDAFLARHRRRELQPHELVRVLKLLELQRHAMLMYTSCGWFFHDLAGIETEQVLLYAGRVVQLAQDLFGSDFEEPFLQRLEVARSNDPEQGSGRTVYERRVRNARVDLLNVAAHYAVSSLFDNGQTDRRVYCYQVAVAHGQRVQSGDTVLLVGRARVTADITLESEVVTYAVLHFGDHNLTGGIRRFAGDTEYRALSDDLLRAFANADITAVVRLLDNFPEYTFSLKSLFADRQRQILYRVLETNVARAESAYRTLYQENASLIRFLINQELPLPGVFRMAAEFVINRDLRLAFTADRIDLQRARSLLEEAEAARVPLDRDGLRYVVEGAFERIANSARAQPEDTTHLELWVDMATLACNLPFDANLWKAQNRFYELLLDTYPEMRERAESGQAAARNWLELFTTLGGLLSVAVP